MPKELSYNEALSKLAALCSKAEQCQQGCREKLYKWGISENEAEKIILYLQQEKYLDDRRFAILYAKDKHTLAHWGKKKIANQLKLKKIPTQFIEEALAEIADEKYDEQLYELLLHKMKSVKAKNKYDLKGKLFRFALGRGFEGDKAIKTIDQLIKEGHYQFPENQSEEYNDFEYEY